MIGSSAYLEGIKVADFGHYIAGAGAGMVLATLGADVIKIEPPEGESTRHNVGGAYIKMFNHSKRGLAIDLRTDAGIEIAKRLIAESDVVVQNMRPGTMARLGLGPDVARSINPGVIYLSLCGFPSTGPSARRAGYDVAAQAEAGMMSVTGDPEGDPQQVGSAVVDVAMMHMAVQAVLAALIRRARTGEGDTIEISLLEVAVALQAQRWSGYLYNGEPPVRLGNRQPVLAPAAELLDTADGHIVVSGYIPSHWRKLCETLGCPELVEDPRFADVHLRVANHTALIEALNQSSRNFDTERLATMLGDAGIVCGRVRTYDQVRASADIVSSALLRPVVGAEYEVLGLPYRSADTPRHNPVRAPGIGEHSAEILFALGYTSAEIAALIKAGVVGTTPQKAEVVHV
jgi:crotonobetainyl-CoA:carnitine CoA-transferase CaiB-like acyl-CoA transferase